MSDTLYGINEFSAATLRRAVKKIDNIRGPYVTSGPDFVTIGAPPTGGGRGAPPTAGNGGVTFKIYSQISGRLGRYQAKIFKGSIVPNATGTLAESNLGTLPGDPDAIAWHVPEIALGSAKHVLKTNAIYTGRRAGSDSNGNAIILFSVLPVGETASPTTIGSNSEGSETAATDTWSRTSGTPVDVWNVGRVVYNHSGDKILYAMVQKLSFDACGILVSISGETRVEVDATVEGSCT